MTVEQYIQKQDKRLKEFSACVGSAVVTIHSLRGQRIFGSGLDKDNSPIGEYNSTDPLYVNPKNAPKKFPTKGKNGDTVFKNGKPHKTGFFESYKAFRANQGRQTSPVNLNLTGTLFKDFASTVIRQGNKWIVGVKNAANKGKVDGAIDKYGRKAFDHSEKELEIYRNKILTCLNK